MGASPQDGQGGQGSQGGQREAGDRRDLVGSAHSSDPGAQRGPALRGTAGGAGFPAGSDPRDSAPCRVYRRKVAIPRHPSVAQPGNLGGAAPAEVMLTVWDLELSQSSLGADSHRLSLAVRGSDYIIVTVDVTDRESFNSVSCWIRRALNYSQGASFLIVGTHGDLISDQAGATRVPGDPPARRAFSKVEIQLLCREYGCTYLQPRSSSTAGQDVLPLLLRRFCPRQRGEDEFTLEDLREGGAQGPRPWWRRVFGRWL